MTSRFYNRIVGAIVIVALSVIILPIIFDGKKYYYQPEFSQIPEVPILIKETPSTAIIPGSPILNDKDKATPPPKAMAYVIQLATLSNKKKVEELKASLSLANYTVFTFKLQSEQGEVTQIFIGPDVSDQKLKAQLPALKALTGLEGVVREYRVNE